ncbi:MAG: hypothetical protein IPL83_11725 [Bdellovibrionales bacterium]|nr:hypothetical protein [Bdellovibrionales bacterium]
MMQWFFGLLVGFGVLIHTLSSEAARFTYSSQGAEIFEVVTNGGESENMPSGIYKLHAKTGELDLLVPGSPTGVHRAYKGILAFLSPSAGIGSSNEALTLINGRLTLFNYNSSPKNKKSYLLLGEKGPGGISLVDVLSGKSIDLPRLEHPDEVMIYDVGTRFRGSVSERLLLISVKVDSFLGNGVTFALLVPLSSGGEKVAVRDDRAVVLGYEYMITKQLERMHLSLGNGGNDFTVLSPLVVENARMQLPRAEDQNGVMSRWRKHLDRVAPYIESGKVKNTEGKLVDSVPFPFAGVPVYNPATGAYSLNEYPIDPVVNESWGQLGLVYDPFSRSYRLVDIPHELGRGQTTAMISGGQITFLDKETAKARSLGDFGIDRDPKSGKYLISGLSWDGGVGDGVAVSHQSAILFFSNGNPNLAVRVSDSKIFQILDLRDGVLDKILVPNAQIEMIRAGTFRFGSRIVHSFLVSARKDRAKYGSVWNIVVEETGSLRLLQTEALMDTLYITAKEMILRLELARPGEPVFDNVTPVSGVAAYLKKKIASAAESDKAGHAVVGSRVASKTDSSSPLSVPYTRLIKNGLGLDVPKTEFGPQVYLRSQLETPILQNQLHFIQYDPTGAPKDYTGFWSYTKPADGSQAKLGDDRYLKLEALGRPLISRIERSTKLVQHTLEERVLQFPRVTRDNFKSVRITLLPFSTAKKTSGRSAEVAKSFSLGIVATPTQEGAANPVFKQVSFDLPYQSFVYSKIVQGEKGNSDLFHIFLFFREDSKIPGSKNAVFVVNGSLDMPALAQGKLQLATSDKKTVFRSFVGSSEYKRHLAVDAEGRYYWVDDPSVGFLSSEIKVRKLLEPDKYVVPRNAALANLRVAEGIRDTDVGYANKRLSRGGVWEIWSAGHLRSRVKGMDDVFDKAGKILDSGSPKKGEKTEKAGSETGETSKPNGSGEDAPGKTNLAGESALFEGFDAFLDRYVEQKTFANRIEVVIVEPSLKEGFKRAMLKKLLGKRGRFSLGNTKIGYYLADETLDDVEIADEMGAIQGQESSGGVGKGILLLEPSLLSTYEVATRAAVEAEGDNERRSDEFETLTVSQKEESEDAMEDPRVRFPGENPKTPSDFLSLVVSGGRAKTPTGLKKLKGKYTTPTGLMIVTMNEWRQIKSRHKQARDYGLLDRFSMNYDFLTSSWTIWPPKSGKVPDDLKALGSSGLYHADEMALFPSLDKLLNKAATGQLSGEQIVFLVPPELLPVVNKLVWLRWMNEDIASSQPWSHGNPKLALSRLSSTGTQTEVLDNLKAVKGATVSRHAVLVGELEAVERLGRPINAKDSPNLMLRDPLQLKARRDLLSDSRIGMDSLAEGGGAAAGNQTAAKDSSEEDRAELEAGLFDIGAEIEGIQEEVLELRERQAQQNYVELEDSKLDFERLEELELQLSTLQKIREKDRIRLASLTVDEDEGKSKAGSSSGGSDKILPHTMWWLATEGQAVQPRKEKGWSLDKSVRREATTILIGTEEQWKRLQGALAPEDKIYRLGDHYEVDRLEAPDNQIKFDRMNSLFSQPEIQALGYEFAVLNGAADVNPRDQLIQHFINRVEGIAYDLNIDSTTAFVKAFVTLRASLTEDAAMRRERRIDENTLGRLFTKVFPMPLNRDILAEGDPLRITHNIRAAVRLFEDYGYKGSAELKATFLNVFNTQTRPADPSKPIPASFLFFGGTGSGKTAMIKTFFKVINLKEYARGHASNEEAGYIFIDVGQLTEKESTDPKKSSVEEAIADIYDLLSQPNGARAHLVFDDFHKATTVAVKRRLYQFIMSLFEAKGGMITVRSKKNDKAREIPVQNLSLYMTLNPANEGRRKNYIDNLKKYKPEELLKKEVLAALSDKDMDLEDSAVARWAYIIPMDHFPRDAKVPELAARIREDARVSPNHFVMVEPSVIDGLVDFFEGADARAFLVPATTALTHVPVNAAPARLYLVTARTGPDGSGSNLRDSFGSTAGAGVGLDDFKKAVVAHTQIDPIVPNDMRSLASFMRLLIREFRLQLGNGLVLQANQTDTLVISAVGQSNSVRDGFIIGLTDHLVTHFSIPPRETILHPEELDFLGHEKISELVEILMGGSKKSDSSYFPFKANYRISNQPANLGDFLDNKLATISQQPDRAFLIAAYVRRVEEVLWGFQRLFLRLPPSEDMSRISGFDQQRLQRWFKDLPVAAPEEEAKLVYQQLIQTFQDFLDEFSSEDKSGSGESLGDLTIYDSARLFGFILDRAVVGLSWPRAAKFLIDVIETARDHSFGSAKNYREYIGKHQNSPFAMTTDAFLREMGSLAQHDARMSQESLMVRRDKFVGVCTRLMAGGRKQ